uniref:Uncharacterized protein n=1 Tax=Octopus bimaculoides TaxID=37653 RepID=A0A0L8G9C9_OCTBM
MCWWKNVSEKCGYRGTATNPGDVEQWMFKFLTEDKVKRQSCLNQQWIVHCHCSYIGKSVIMRMLNNAAGNKHQMSGGSDFDRCEGQGSHLGEDRS